MKQAKSTPWHNRGVAFAAYAQRSTGAWGNTVTEYLKLDSTRLSLAEYWRWKPGMAFLMLAGMKLLGWRLAPTVMVPAVASVDVVDPLVQPPELVAALAHAIKACEARGRTIQFWYTVPTVGSNLGLGAALVSGDGLSVAMAVLAETRAGTYRDVVLGLVSRLRSGRFLTTGPGKSLFDAAPEVDALRLRGRSYAQLVDAHDSIVSSRKSELVACGDARELILELQRLQVHANVARGVYVPASPQDVARVKQVAERRRTNSGASAAVSE
jgi:hypothetical protein